MLADNRAYSGIAVNDMAAARCFYADTLGLKTSEEYGLMWLRHAKDHKTLVYEQPDTIPASFTVGEALAYVRSLEEPPDPLLAVYVVGMHDPDAEQHELLDAEHAPDQPAVHARRRHRAHPGQWQSDSGEDSPAEARANGDHEWGGGDHEVDDREREERGDRGEL